jgi:hypothetical protein
MVQFQVFAFFIEELSWKSENLHGFNLGVM